VDIAQYSRLIDWGNLVNPLPGGAGFLQGFNGGDDFPRILGVNENLLRHGMFQCRAENAGLQHELLGFARIAVVAPGNRKQRDVERYAAGLNGFGDAEKGADFRLVTESAGTQLVMAASLQAHGPGTGRSIGFLGSRRDCLFSTRLSYDHNFSINIKINLTPPIQTLAITPTPALNNFLSPDFIKSWTARYVAQIIEIAIANILSK